MQANDLLAAGRYDAWTRALLARLEALAAPEFAGAPVVVLDSKAQPAEALGVDVNTVRRWLRKGKTGRNGELVKPQAYHFAPEPRRPALPSTCSSRTPRLAKSATRCTQPWRRP